MTDPTPTTPSPVDTTLYAYAVLWQTGRVTVEAAVATTPEEAARMHGPLPPGALAERLISIPVPAEWFPAAAAPADPSPVL